jgi:CRISPR Csm4 C-terminal domain
VFGSDAARDRWTMRLRSAGKLLADTGLGGGRSLGWGRSDEPRFESVADWTRMLTGAAENEVAGESAWWLLSLFSPAASDAVDWRRGNYSICVRAGRTESLAVWGALKQATRMVAEGSVLLSGSALTGAARNVATAEIPHAVYRSGIAMAVPIPWKESRRLPWMTVSEGAPEASIAETAGAVEVLDSLESGPQAESLPHLDKAEAEENVVEPARLAELDSAAEAGPFAGEDVLTEQGLFPDPAAEEPVAPPVEAPTPSGPPAEEPPAEIPPAEEPPPEPPVTEPDAPEPGSSTPEPDPNKEDAAS